MKNYQNKGKKKERKEEGNRRMKNNQNKGRKKKVVRSTGKQNI